MELNIRWKGDAKIIGRLAQQVWVNQQTWQVCCDHHTAKQKDLNYTEGLTRHSLQEKQILKKLDFSINWAKCYKKATTNHRIPHDNPMQWSIPTEVRLHLSQEQPSLPPPNLLNISFLLLTRQNSRTRRIIIPSKITHQSQRHCLLSATLF